MCQMRTCMWSFRDVKGLFNALTKRVVYEPRQKGAYTKSGVLSKKTLFLSPCQKFIQELLISFKYL